MFSSLYSSHHHIFMFFIDRPFSLHIRFLHRIFVFDSTKQQFYEGINGSLGQVPEKKWHNETR